MFSNVIYTSNMMDILGPPSDVLPVYTSSIHTSLPSASSGMSFSNCVICSDLWYDYMIYIDIIYSGGHLSPP